MKTYPSISTEISNTQVYAFDKLDGSNVRAEWNKKQGFFKFGKRNHLLDDSNPILQETKQLVLEKYSEDLTQIFRNQRWERAVCFFEFVGPNSFAGLHENEDHEVVLFDVAGPRGILAPQDFLRLFENVSKIPMLYHGEITPDFVQKVRTGNLEGMTFEGVVCKGPWVSPGRPLMFKIKNQAWIDKVRQKYAGNETLIAQII